MREVLGLNRIGWRLLGAFLIVASLSIAVMVIGMLATEQQVHTQSSADTRTVLARELAASAALAYARADGWTGVDLSGEQVGADRSGFHLVVRDTDGRIVWGAPVGPNFTDRAVAAPVTSEGKTVGSVLIGSRNAGGPAAADALSHWWFAAAALVAASVALLLAFVLARRMTRPIDRYIETARQFAAGDHSARPSDLGPPEFAELTLALGAAADEIERSELARRQLAGDIAHELRTPLAALQAGLEELRDGFIPADRQTLAALHDQATRLGRIVNDLSEMSAAESAGLQVQLQSVDLAEVASLALAAREGSMAAAGLVVGRALPSGVIVIGDPDRLQQVVGNLLANTVLYCRAGDRVMIRVRREGAHGVLEVSDTGPGFRADELPSVFDRAWRGASADGTQGSGLGLPIVKALVLAQGGTVSVDSTHGQGATLSIRLPAAPLHEPVAGVGAAN